MVAWRRFLTLPRAIAISTVVPDPKVLSISTLPPCSSAKCFTIGKPIPPRPLPFVVKKGSKARTIVSRVIPIPLSSMRSSTRAAMALNDCCGVNRDQTAVRHCVARVEHEIQDRVLQTQTIAFHGRQVGSNADLETDVRLPCGSDQRLDLGQAGTYVRLLKFAMTSPRLCRLSPGQARRRAAAPSWRCRLRARGLEPLLNARIPCDAVQRG